MSRPMVPIHSVEPWSQQSIAKRADQPEVHNLRLRALNSTGTIGSLYYAGLNHFVECPMIRNRVIQITHGDGQLTCELKKTPDHASFLKLFEMHNTQKLNIVLCSHKDQSPFVQFVNNQRKRVNHHTQCLHYRCIYIQNSLTCSGDSSAFSDVEAFVRKDLNVTHIVTRVIWGIEAFFMVHLPSNDMEKRHKAQNLLYKIRMLVKSNKKNYDLTDDDVHLWSELETAHYLHGNFTLPTTLSIKETLSTLIKYEPCPNAHLPLVYELSSINLFFPNSRLSQRRIHPLNLAGCDTILQKLYIIADSCNSLCSTLSEFPLDWPSNSLQQRAKNVRTEIRKISNTTESLIEKLRQLLIQIGLGEQVLADLHKEFKKDEYNCLRSEYCTAISDECDYLICKAQMISELYRKKVEYKNIADYLSSDDCVQPATWKTCLSEIAKGIQDSHIRFICCSDEFLNMNSYGGFSFWLQNKLQNMSEIDSIKDLCIIYVDLTSCQHDLLREYIAQYDRSILNVLILGESGVGKSTFINAFVNYLTFDTLGEAQAAHTLPVLIPVAFTMINDDTFENVRIQFGEPNSNEDHVNPGKSTTQRCKSYIFDISDRLKLRLIDTPGINDTRGPEQDELNMQHIFSYVNSFKELNAVCILLKPNTTRLNPVFHSCLSQLFNYLGEAVRDNILFCFTNSRSTLFLPGDTGPLLSKMIQSFPVSNIPFNPKNTFCFDSESFRYLVAAKHEIPFNDYEREQCEKSWRKSVTEATRFLSFVSRLQPHSINCWNSQKRAEFEVKLLVRPVMETMRNTLYNKIIQRIPGMLKSIVLTAIPIDLQSAMCIGRRSLKPILCGDKLCMIVRPIHPMQSIEYPICSKCTCLRDDHIFVDYAVKHEVMSYRAVGQNYNKHFGNFEQCCVEMAKFDHSIVDKLLLWLNQFIEEEDFICKNLSMSSINQEMHSSLTSLQTRLMDLIRRESSHKKMMDTEQRLNYIYKWIHWVKQDPRVDAQIKAIEEGQKSMLKTQDYVVNMPTIANRAFKQLRESL